MKPSDFYTVPKSESGIQVPIPLPQGGDSTEWVRVIGLDSLAFAQASSDLNKALAEAKAITDERERDEFSNRKWRDYVSKLIVGWSFDEPFTPEAVDEFIKNAPRVGQYVQEVATDVRRFFGPASPSSTDGQTSSGDSRAEAESIAQNA